jgi:hypothetical protein
MEETAEQVASMHSALLLVAQGAVGGLQLGTWGLATHDRKLVAHPSG